VKDADLKLMYRIDKLHMEFPSRAGGCCRVYGCRKASRSAGCTLPR
jgi:hypothetical protein